MGSFRIFGTTPLREFPKHPGGLKVQCWDQEVHGRFAKKWEVIANFVTDANEMFRKERKIAITFFALSILMYIVYKVIPVNSMRQYKNLTYLSKMVPLTLSILCLSVGAIVQGLHFYHRYKKVNDYRTQISTLQNSEEYRQWLYPQASIIVNEILYRGCSYDSLPLLPALSFSALDPKDPEFFQNMMQRTDVELKLNRILGNVAKTNHYSWVWIAATILWIALSAFMHFGLYQTVKKIPPGVVNPSEMTFFRYLGGSCLTIALVVIPLIRLCYIRSGAREYKEELEELQKMKGYFYVSQVSNEAVKDICKNL